MGCPRHLKKQGYNEYIDPKTRVSRGVKGKGKDKKVILKATL